MKLQTKILFFWLCVSGILMGTLYLGYTQYILPKVAFIEEKSLSNESELPQKFIKQEANHLNNIIQTLGLLYETLPSHQYPDETHLLEKLKYLNIDWFALINEDKTSNYHVLMDKLISKSSLQELIHQLNKDYPSYFNQTITTPQTHLILTAEGPALIASLRINSNQSSLQSKIVVLGRFIDNSFKAQLNQILPHEGYLWPLAHAPLSSEQNAQLSEFKNLPEGVQLTQSTTRKWLSFSALHDYLGQPQLLIETMVPRPYNKIFNESFILICGLCLFFILFIMVALNGLLNKHIYRPLQGTLAQLSILVEKTKIKGELKIAGQHEFDELIMLINQVIKMLNYHHHTALQHTYNEGLNEMRSSYIKEIKRLLKPIIKSLNELDNAQPINTIKNIEKSVVDLIQAFPQTEHQVTFIESIKSQTNQFALAHHASQAKIKDIINRCGHLSNLLRAHTIHYDKELISEDKRNK